ncbi:FadR/GntR family transcriptional regulator [Microbacterium radiodurans]|uniref:FadR family transcriptional regulator n=1 Tax=Microbacterium radiodurans TaxID=661398 RepID=A0A5J5IUU5_9MICO|nr:FadR/GntR family transcriptional regulator [Microbacterium radiodurans]KAA9089126.1 FadR family transcriptional regulator [Microbacterium radiodurans]
MNKTIDWGAVHEQSPSLADSLSMSLERLVLEGGLRDGDRLPPERDLAVQLGVSRGSLREALRALELRGLLERTPGRGTIVRDATRSAHADVLVSGLALHTDDFMQALEVRACIEPPMAARAAQRATDLDIAQLRRILDDMARDIDAAEFSRLDRLFHRAIAQYTYNPLLVRLLDRVSEILDVTRSQLPINRATRRRALADHRAILDAVASHDPDAASAAAAAHIAGMHES